MNQTPLRSVRMFCLWCCNHQSLEVKLCPATSCVLHRYRLGKGNISVKTIRDKCIDCSDGELSNIKDCKFGKPLPLDKQDKPECHPNNYPCPLYQFRMGKNPNITQKGNVDTLLEYRKNKKITGLQCDLSLLNAKWVYTLGLS